MAAAGHAASLTAGAKRIPDCRAAAHQHGSGDRDRRRRNRPGFVTREARGRQREARAHRPAPRTRVDPRGRERDRGGRRRKEQRFGHRRALQVQHVRVADEQHGGGNGAARRSRGAQDQRRQRPHGHRGADHGDGHRRRAGAIQRVNLHRQHVQEVRQRKPHGADLLPSGSEAVDDAARHDEMRTRIVVAQRQTGRGVVDGRRGSGRQRRRGDQKRGAFVPFPRGHAACSAALDRWDARGDQDDVSLHSAE